MKTCEISPFSSHSGAGARLALKTGRAGLAGVLLGAALFCAACEKESKAPAEAPALPVVVMEVTPQKAPLVLSYVGQTAGSKETEVRAQVGGILKKKLYVEGDRVKAGDILFQIDPVPYETRLRSARGALAKAQAALKNSSLSYHRAQELYKEDVIAAQEMDNATASFHSSQGEVETAAAELEQAKINLGYTTVTAPVSGVTALEAVSEGSLIDVTTGATLLTTITTLDPIYVNFTAPGVEIMRLRSMPKKDISEPVEDQIAVDITLADGSTYDREGKITYFGSTMDPRTGAIKGRAQFANPDHFVLPGQYVKVNIRGATLNDAILVPQRAVISGQQTYSVLVVNKDDTVESRTVAIGDSVGNDFMILSGLKPGERVIVDGIQKARPGAKVVPTLMKTPQAPAAGAPEAPLAPGN